MSHCPQCGRPIALPGAVACSYCGASLVPVAKAPQAAAAKTMLGVAASALMPAASAPAKGVKVSQTIVGMPANLAPPAADGSTSANSPQPAAINRTIVGMEAPQVSAPAGAPNDELGTLLGVARPGIAPLEPGVERPVEAAYDNASPGGEPSHELGATIGPAMDQGRDFGGGWHDVNMGRPKAARLLEPRRAHKAAAPTPLSKRALALLGAGGVLALGAVVFALLWPSSPPLLARARTDAEGREAVEITCSNCSDGTKVTLNGATATIADKTALVTLPSELSLGENLMKVAIDRPGDERDESVGLTVNVAYRIRPDLSLLQSDKPSIQIVAEASRGTGISIGGKALQISGGRAIELIDVTEACTGLSDEPKTLSRQIPYVVTPADGPEEHGVVNVSVGIAPLRMDAPGTHVTTEGTSFVLAGRTMRGAELSAAGKPITVKPDGSFVQVMNVSSVGATEIDVWAKMVSLAPRRVKIRVRRVESLQKAAQDFMAEGPLGYEAFSVDIAGNVGKSVAIAGEVLEARRQNHTTVMLLDVASSAGCANAGSCKVRLVQGRDNPAKKGDQIRAFGRLAGAFSVTGKPDVPEIDVEFTLKGLK